MAIIEISNGDGFRPARREEAKRSLASDFDNPIVTPSMLRGETGEAVFADETYNPITPSSLSKTAQSKDNFDPTTYVQKSELLEGSQFGPRTFNEKIASAPTVTTAIATPVMIKESAKIWSLEEVDLLTDPANIKSIDPTLFSRDSIHPLSALIALNFWFEEKWLGWEPETLWEVMKDRGVTTEINRSVKDTIMAIRSAIRINDFYSNYQAFSILCNAFNHKIVDFHSFQPPSIAEMSNAVKILSIIRDDDEYQLEVKAYIKAIADYEGLLVLPSELHFVNANDEALAEDVLPRALELEEVPTKASEISVIDSQALKYLVCKSYCINENKTFSDEINSFISIHN